MAKGKQPSKPSSSLFRGILRFFRKGRQAIEHWLQGWVIKVKRRSQTSQAGFVLPTVTMVLLVVVLLTFAISFRAFERSKIAQFRRVDEAVLQAATPALDRARSKIDYLLQEDKTLPRATPSDDELYRALTSDFYTLLDETQLRIEVEDEDNDDQAQEDFIDTAWRFPVDTNNDGEIDSYTLYGIYFLVPKIAAGEDDRARTAIEARTPPMQSVRTLRDECAIAGTSADLIDGSGWVKQDGKLRKSFFVYAVTVPIDSNSGGYSALEYQQDRTRIPLTNNAVIYEDDLEITPGDEFRLNGRIITNSNLITSRFPAGELRYYLVSSTNSCFYEVENSKILVGGNVINGMSGNEQGRNIIAIPVDLFEQGGNPPQQDIAEGSQSITEGAYDGLYDSQAYEGIIRGLVLAQIAGGGDPTVVQETIDRRLDDDNTLDEDEVRQEELDAYFRARTRKVPFADSADATAYANSISFGGAGDELRPTDEWTNPENSDLNLVANQLLADNPANFEDDEPHLGNRILVGNNQPALEFEDGEFREATFTLGQWDDDGTDRERPTQIQELPDIGETDRHGFWEKAAAEEPDPVLEGTGGLRVITGAGVYERDSSFLPPPPAAPPVVAGTPNPFTVVWPDSMPMSPSEGEEVYDNTGGGWGTLPTTLPPAPAGSIDPSTPKYAKGDLKMRASAVYHYAQDAFDGTNDPEQKPIACVSSYHDPTNETTAKNPTALGWNDDPDGKSNNGIVYAAPTTRPGPSTPNGDGLFTGGTPLEQQANMVFPDGRFVNEPLREALQSNNRNLAEQAAIDSTLCAIGILDGSLSRSTTFIPDGAIYETAFLNAREAKAIEQDNDTTDADETFTLQPDGELTDNYDLPLEDRHPLEIRATVLDVNLLRNQGIGFSGVTGPSPEYLLPNSGIIYASRDDALPDRSEPDDDTTEALSPTDFKLDPTRRPNGILLINGKYLARNDADDDGQNDSGLSGDVGEAVQQIVQEKGLTLVSNLPTYIKGEFNLHSKQEFRGADELDEDWGNFYDRGADPNDFDPDFACRPGDPRLPNCTEGDTWRPATVLADSVTLLSDNFEFGYRNQGDFDLRNNAGVVATPGGYDLDGNGTIDTTANIDETNFSVVGTLLTNLSFDLNENGTIGETISESNIAAIPAKLARQRNGFNAYNNFVTNGLSSTGIDPDVTDEDYVNDTNDVVDSSYFNNFVTPIQRRGDFPEYVMEICRKLPVSACEPGDWVVGYDGDPDIKMADLPNTLNGLPTAIDAFNSGDFDPSLLMAGTTAQPAVEEEDRRFPRRIAFLRDATSDDQLILNSNLPIPLGISGTDNSAPDAGALECYLYQGSYNWDWDNSPGSDHSCVLYTSDRPRLQENALWFRTTENSSAPSTTTQGEWNYGYNFPLWYANNLTGNTVEQPILVPVLQIHATDNEPEANVADFPLDPTAQANKETSWLIRMPSVITVEYNLVVGAGDVPSRPDEFNGGLQNLARTLENWNGVVVPGNDSDTSTIKIQGSFVQLRRSRYSSAPYISAENNPGIFGTTAPANSNRYNIQNAGGRIGYFTAPARQWGFDVGLLSQPPDLFAQKFSTPPSVPSPDEYFREVSRDDEWVEKLLCAQTLDPNDEPDGDAVPDDRIRPDDCPN